MYASLHNTGVEILQLLCSDLSAIYLVPSSDQILHPILLDVKSYLLRFAYCMFGCLTGLQNFSNA